MAQAALKFELEEESIGFLDLSDPEIEYTEPPPRLVLIVNEHPVQAKNWVDHSRDGVDLSIFCGDPDEVQTMDQELSEQETQDAELEEHVEAVLIPPQITAPVLPEPREPLSLALHKEAIAGRPQDRLQAYFIASLDRPEIVAYPQLAAQVLKARHDLYLVEANPGTGAEREQRLEELLGQLLVAMPEENTPVLLGSWRAGLSLLSELMEEV